MSTIISENWCNIETNELQTRIKNLENYTETLQERIIVLEKIIQENNVKRENEIQKISEHLREITNEHLKTMNRMLEAEISLERTKNLLVRNHIPFSFRNNLSTILTSSINQTNK